MVVKEKIGRVVSDRMMNTIIVAVDDRIRHKKYGKVVTRTKRYAVHVSDQSSKIGDTVVIRRTRPLSRTKSWILTSVLNKSST
jgi:small subunit ribosomal protein S17